MLSTMITVYSVLCQLKSALSLAFTLSWTKNLFCPRGEFKPIALSPVCYLMTGLIADCSAAWFSSLVNDEHTVMGDWRDDMLEELS